MKFGRVTKRDKKNKTASKKIDDNMTCRKIVTSLPFFQLIVNLKKSGSQIPDAGSVKMQGL